MAAKWKKILLGTTLAGAAVAGGLAYFLSRKEKENSWEDDLEDFDDNLNFHEDDDEEGEDAAPVSREYVTIPTENHSASETLKDALRLPREKTDKLPFPRTKRNPLLPPHRRECPRLRWIRWQAGWL